MDPLIVVPDHAPFSQTGICWEAPAMNVVA